MPSSERKSEQRITLQALKYYVPIYQCGDRAAARLLSESESMTPAERNSAETLLRQRELAVRRITDLASPLINREIHKLIAASHLRNRDDIFDVLFWSGVDGMRLGLRKFDVDKMNQSSTNYLFQWIITYARKELNVLEAPFGIPPSRFQVYKKISAVRKKLTEIQGEYADNEAVLEYFHSGKADLKTMNGRVANRDKPSQANRNITLDIVEEQERFEKNMMNVHLLDPQEDYSTNVKMTSKDNELFEETAFGVFTQEYNVTSTARAVIKSELRVHGVSDEEQAIIDSLSEKEYRTLSNRWKTLIRDKNGPFYEFLVDHEDDSTYRFDVRGTIRNIEAYEKSINSDLYMVLFEGERAEKNV